MRISEISIRRPVLATVMSLVIVLIGVVSFGRLTVRQYPDIDVPIVSITTRYPGASAEIIETQVTSPLEDVLSGLEGIDFISSISRSERSLITVVFRQDRNPDGAAADVRDRVGRVRGRLPDDAEEPIIAKVEADARPIMWIGFSSDRHNMLELTDIMDRRYKDRFQTLPGVADIFIGGRRRYAMRIWLDRSRMAAYGVTPGDVEQAIRAQNLELPSGRIESAEREFTVLAESDLATVEEFDQIILREDNGYLVRLKDVGRAEIAAEDKRQLFRNNGQPATSIGIVKQSTANPLDVGRAVRAEIDEIQQNLPEGMKLFVAYDSTVFIERSISAVFTTIAEAIALVALVIFLFLRTWRATIIPLVTIPGSLIGAFGVMYLFNFSVNTLTLLAMVLAIGLVVDDAIVMLENIQRHVENGMGRMQAALAGANQIGFAVLAMTLTLAAVYIPIAFTTGQTGKLFIEFAITLAGAVIVSGFMALTLTPMMASRLLRETTPAEAGHEGLLTRITHRYRALLERALMRRQMILGIGLAVAGIAFALYRSLPAELSPIEDRSFIFVAAMAPEGATLDYTSKYVEKLEKILLEIPEVRNAVASIGRPSVTRARMYVNLKPWEERDRSSLEIAEQLNREFRGVPGLLAFPIVNSGLSRGDSKPVNFVIQTTESYENLDRLVERILERARGNPGFRGLDADLKLNKPELKIRFHRDKIADVGSDVRTIGQTLATMLGGRKVTRYRSGGEEYEVIVQVEDVDRRNPADLTAIFVRGSNDQMVQLSNLVTVEEGVAPRELNHFNKLRAATITSNLTPGYSMGEGLEFLERIAREIAPSSVRFDYGGLSREFMEASGAMFFTFLLALTFIYLVLAAQFESFIDPFIILTTVPLAISGALLGLAITGGSLNLFTQIGLITLVGLITKHGILIVEFSNQLQRKGYTIHEAVVEAATMRLRPILMTTGAMVLGAMPLAIATGAGAESRNQIGWVIVGGLLLGTLLTLFVIPVVYSYIARRHAPDEAPDAVPADSESVQIAE